MNWEYAAGSGLGLFKYYSRIFVEELSKPMKIISNNCRSLVRESYSGLKEYETGMLNTQPQYLDEVRLLRAY